MRNQRVMQFVKRIISLPILFIIGCSSPFEPTEPHEYTVQIKPYCDLPVLEGDSIPTLYLDEGNWQTIHMLSVEVMVDSVPIQYASIDWSSDLYWELNDTIGYFVHQWLTDDMEYVAYDTNYVTNGGLHDLVPTSNYSSRTDIDGIGWNAIAPVKSMRGEIMTLQYSVWIGHNVMERFTNQIKIRLR